MKTINEINERIKKGKVVVVTAEEVIAMASNMGYAKTAERVDIVTTGTFGPMCSSGVFLNFGHSSPAIKMQKIKLNDVPAHGGLAAVDTYIASTELSETRGMEYGGGHVIEDLVAGKDIKLYATSYGTDCYPRREILTSINKFNINQAYMYNPRNCYQNYPAATNSTDTTLYTYMGTLLPHFGNITYSTSGELSPLLKDPYLRTIGIGTRIFLGGTTGYVSWQGTQHNPNQVRNEKGVPVSLAATIAVIGDIKGMSTRYVRGATYERYGTTLFVGIGIPIPILDEDMLAHAALTNRDITTKLSDKSNIENLDVSYTYQQLQEGWVEFRGKRVPTAPLSSIPRAREIAQTLKQWIAVGEFTLTQPVAPLQNPGNIQKLAIREIK